MANVAVYNMEGKEVDKIELNDSIFGVEINEHLVHMAVLQQLANKRQGTQKAKTRSEVRAPAILLLRHTYANIVCVSRCLKYKERGIIKLLSYTDKPCIAVHLGEMLDSLWIAIIVGNHIHKQVV